MGEYIVYSLEKPVNEAYSPLVARYRRSSCKRCISRKVACDGTEPCSRCRSADAKCEYGYMRRMPSKKRTKAKAANSESLKPFPLANSLGRCGVDIPAPGATAAAIKAVTKSGYPVKPSPIPLDPLTVAIQVLNSSNIYDIGGGVKPFLKGLEESNAAAADNDDTIDPKFLWDTLFSHLQHAIRQNTRVTSIPAATLYIRQVVQRSSSLKSEEEHVYNPFLVHSLLTIFVNQQTRIFRELYLQRIFRKLAANDISPFALNTMLAYGASMIREESIGFQVHQKVAMTYIERADDLLVQELERPSLDTPFLTTLMAAPWMIAKQDDRFMYYATLGRRMAIQLNFHLTDSTKKLLLMWDDAAAASSSSLSTSAKAATMAPPTVPSALPTSPPKDCATKHAVLSPNDELVKEYKRRSYWVIAIYDNVVSCLLGLPCNLTKEYAKVNAFDDSLIEQLLRCDPEHDHYPTVIPGISYTLCGSPYVTEFVSLIGEIAERRIQSQNESHMNITVYRALNRRLRAWYASLPAAYSLPRLPLDDGLISSNPVHYSALFTLHCNYHMVVIFINVYNWVAGPNIIRPEQDPECHRLGLESANFITKYCLPFFHRLPGQYHSAFVVSGIFAAAFKYGLSLRHMGTEDRIATVKKLDGCIAFLEKSAPYITYARVFIAQLQQIIAAALPSKISTTAPSCYISTT
ncbi:hypothetical protein H4R34_003306 [Dimargaris verticillata]|uniref:Zn(2)-C6 fungal-type domain-containing protein n=1 Tax=Dimargaris verticillata TaxID=2761393 RepID=A0A9W8B128_9FUNG|nr:hypothetical protein H4R34_003306 [Dimargaris verticillata]